MKVYGFGRRLRQRGSMRFARGGLTINSGSGTDGFADCNQRKASIVVQFATDLLNRRPIQMLDKVLPNLAQRG